MKIWKVGLKQDPMKASLKCRMNKHLFLLPYFYFWYCPQIWKFCLFISFNLLSSDVHHASGMLILFGFLILLCLKRFYYFIKVCVMCHVSRNKSTIPIWVFTGFGQIIPAKTKNFTDILIIKCWINSKEKTTNTLTNSHTVNLKRFRGKNSF